MTAFSRELPDAAWYRGLKIPASVIRNIDEKTKKAVSGTGGTWAPSSPIILGGSGLELQCGAQLNGTASASPGAGKAFIFGDDDYFRFAALRARSVVDSPCLLLSKDQLQREARPWSSIAAVTPSIRTKRANAFVRCPLRIPDGSLLSSVEIGFKVGQSHANAPATFPKARVVRISAAGVIEQHPNPSSSSYDPDGWVSAAAASGAAWYNGGALQTLTLSYDYANTEEADSSLYGYALEWFDEWGSNAFTDDVGTYLVYFKSTVYQADLRPY